MEISEGLSQQERLQAIAEKRKKQTEIENKKRQLEDDRRQLQHLKSKALRERWLLEGAPSAGSEQDEVKKQLEEDEAKTRSLEETIMRMEQELIELETGGSLSATHTKENLQEDLHNAVTADSVKEVKVHKSPRLDKSGGASDMIVQEVKVHKSPRVSKSAGVSGMVMKEVKVVSSPRLDKSGGVSDTMMRAAMYSVEITVERDNVTGETKVLSTSTLLPVDLSHHGVKVYEDELKVVHEMNGENDVHQLTSTEVDELIYKADEASMMSQTVSGVTITTVSKAEPQDGTAPEPQQIMQQPKVEITGMEATSGGASPQPGIEVGIDEASSDNPVTMVFMGYQSVEDEAETKKVLGLEGTVKAELVVIEDGDGKTSPMANATPAVTPEVASPKEAPQTAPPNGSAATAEPPAKAQETVASDGEKSDPEASAGDLKNKEKQPCKCCTIM